MLCLHEMLRESSRESLRDNKGIWAAIGPDSRLKLLEPLRAAHGRHTDALLISASAADIESVAARFKHRRATLLVVEQPDRPSLRPRFHSPFVDRHGQHLLGWLRLDDNTLTAYAERAAALLTRGTSNALAVALLGPRERRYLELLSELESNLHTQALRLFNWSAERIRPVPLARALQCGMGGALHAGHGNAAGWFAYGGMNAAKLSLGSTWTHDQSCALLFSLACQTASPLERLHNAAERPPHSFADEIIACGVAGAVVAPMNDPLHANNRQLANALIHALAAGHRHLHDVLESAQQQGAPLRGYCVIGDPGLAAAASAHALRSAQAVFAPPADATGITPSPLRGTPP